MRMHNIWAQTDPIPQMRIFSENLLMSYMPKIKVRYYSITEILTIQKYRNLIGWVTFLAITWEPDFSQACNFRTMLMNHRNFHFTQIPDKTNDVFFFLKCPKTMFWAIFDHFGHFCPMRIFSKKSSCHTELYMGT